MRPFCLAFTRRNAGCLSGIILLLLVSLQTAAQNSNYTKENQRHQYIYYKQSDNALARACHILGRKRYHSQRTRSRKPSIDNKNRVLSSSVGVKPLPKPVPAPQIQPEPVVSNQELEQLHKKEDDILAENKLPVPTSSKHEELRNRVADDLKKNPLDQPRPLAPLYFQFNQDEFSVVDMEPFLIAVEYALQGRHVLVEGHTDSRGQDDTNVKLSVKRVQRIRQLMLDMGVPDDHISIVGYGEEHSKDKNIKSEDGHQNNRRVDFTVF
jgi:outer membrane protein OmpA-like peptidoglycan-associated protein